MCQFLKIQGRKHRGKEEISIIDVTADSQVDRMELMKTLSEETQTTSHSSKKKGMPGSQARRKHQITYLAFQVNVFPIMCTLLFNGVHYMLIALLY